MGIFDFLRIPDYRRHIRSIYLELTKENKRLVLESAEKYEEILCDLCGIMGKNIESLNENELRIASEIYFYALHEGVINNQRQYVVANKLASKYAQWVKSGFMAKQIIAYSVIKATHADFRLCHENGRSSIELFVKQINQQMKNAITHEEKVNVAYSEIPDKYEYLVFPKGIDQAEVVIQGIAHLIQIELDEVNSDTYSKLLSMMVAVYIFDSKEAGFRECIEFLNDKYSASFDGRKNWKLVYWYCHLALNQGYFPLSDENYDLVMWCSAYYSEEPRFVTPEYGLSIEYPLYTNGISGMQYVNTLFTLDDEKLKWRLNRTYSLSNEPYRVDTYEGYRESGELYRIIYLSENKNPTNRSRIPVGLKKV